MSGSNYNNGLKPNTGMTRKQEKARAYKLNGPPPAKPHVDPFADIFGDLNTFGVKSPPTQRTSIGESSGSGNVNPHSMIKPKATPTPTSDPQPRKITNRDGTFFYTYEPESLPAVSGSNSNTTFEKLNNNSSNKNYTGHTDSKANAKSNIGSGRVESKAKQHHVGTGSSGGNINPHNVNPHNIVKPRVAGGVISGMNTGSGSGSNNGGITTTTAYASDCKQQTGHVRAGAPLENFFLERVQERYTFARWLKLIQRYGHILRSHGSESDSDSDNGSSNTSGKTPTANKKHSNKTVLKNLSAKSLDIRQIAREVAMGVWASSENFVGHPSLSRGNGNGNGNDNGGSSSLPNINIVEDDIDIIEYNAQDAWTGGSEAITRIKQQWREVEILEMGQEGGFICFFADDGSELEISAEFLRNRPVKPLPSTATAITTKETKDIATTTRVTERKLKSTLTYATVFSDEFIRNFVLVWLCTPNYTPITRLQGHTGNSGVHVMLRHYNTLYTGGGEGDCAICVWNLDAGYESNQGAVQGTPIGVLDMHTGAITALVIYEDILFSSSTDKSIRAWSLLDLKPIGFLTGYNGHTAHSAAVKDMLIYSDKLISYSADHTIKVWDCGTFQCVTILEGHTSAITCMVQPTGTTRLFSGSCDKTIRCWDVADNAQLTAASANASGGGGKSLTTPIKASDLTEKRSNATKNLLISIMNGHEGAIECMVVGPPINVRGLNSTTTGSSILFTASKDFTIRAWNINTCRLLAVMEGHFDEVSTMIIHDYRLYSGSKDKEILVWDISLFKAIAILSGHTNRICSLIGYGDKILSGSSDGTIRVWSTWSFQHVKTLLGCSDQTNKMIVHDNKLYLASKDKGIRVWVCRDEDTSKYSSEKCLEEKGSGRVIP